MGLNMTSAEMEATVTAAYDTWNAAFNNADAKALGATYLGDAKLLPPAHIVMSGRDEIETFFGSLFANGVTGHTLEVIEVGGEGSLVYAAARWRAKGKGEGDVAQDFGGIAIHLFERQDDGALKLKLHTFN